MPPNSQGRKTRRYSKSRAGAQTSIKQAWRKRERRRKGGLVARTAKANRTAIKKLKKSIEINMKEDTMATIANRFGGQYLPPTQVSDTGNDPTPLSLVQRPLRGVAQGNESWQRNGDKVKMTSLTYRVQFTATTGLLADTHNYCGMIVVLDNQPGSNSGPNLMGSAGTGAVNDGTLLGGLGPLAYQKFQNTQTCGKGKRYKVLKHHKVLIQPVTATSVKPPQALINHTLKLPYSIEYGVGSTDPINKEILFFYYSSSGAAPSPSVSCYCRFRYRDA